MDGWVSECMNEGVSQRARSECVNLGLIPPTGISDGDIYFQRQMKWDGHLQPLGL